MVQPDSFKAGKAIFDKELLDRSEPVPNGSRNVSVGFQRLEEAANRKLLELVSRKVTVCGTYSRAQMSLFRAHAWELAADDICYRLETEMLCQSRGKQQQTVQFWVPTSWWQHLKRTILHRWFERAFVEGEKSSYQTKGWGFRRWIGQRIDFRLKSVEKTVEWEVLDSYPMADIPVPELGTPVRIVIPKDDVE